MVNVKSDEINQRARGRALLAVSVGALGLCAFIAVFLRYEPAGGAIPEQLSYAHEESHSDFSSEEYSPHRYVLEFNKEASRQLQSPDPSGFRNTFDYPIDEIIDGCRMGVARTAQTSMEIAQVRACGSALSLFNDYYCWDRPIPRETILGSFVGTIDEEGLSVDTSMADALRKAFPDCGFVMRER